MRRLLVPALLLAAATLGTVAQDAAAANATVEVGNDRTLTPTLVSVAPGDTVTWEWVGPDTDHRVASFAGQAESWDSLTNSKPQGSTFVKTVTNSGAFTYRCLIHPDDMQGTVRVGLPAAQLNASATNPFTDEAITLDASGSTDPGGGIVKYEWDLDGNNTFETDTGLTSSTPATFAAAGPVTVRVRVRDAEDRIDIATRAITVRSRFPAASFTAPATAFRNVLVNFDAAASLPNGGTITGYEWDLDGDATEDFDPIGTSSTASASFTTLGVQTIRLRVTDSEGLTHKVTRTVTVNNQLPVAAFTPANTAQAFTFTATGSSDPEGGALTYAWDLDGDNVFETTTGTTNSAQRTYTTGGAKTVRLRVTDPDGGSTVSTQTINVPAPPAPPPPPPPPPPVTPVVISDPGPPAPVIAAPSLATPTPTPPIVAAAAQRPLTLALASGSRLKSKGGKVAVRVTCSAACTITAGGTLTAGGKKLKLRALTKALRAGATTLTLAVSRRDLAKLRRARRGSALVTVSAPGAAVQRVRVSLS